MIPVRENSEVVIIYPDVLLANPFNWIISFKWSLLSLRRPVDLEQTAPEQAGYHRKWRIIKPDFKLLDILWMVVKSV